MSLLDQLLKSGQQMLAKKTGAQGSASRDDKGGLGDLLGSGGLGGHLLTVTIWKLPRRDINA